MRSWIAAVLALVLYTGITIAPAVAAENSKQRPYCPTNQLPRSEADERFDSARLVGRSVQAARQLANRHGCSLRVVKRNGELLIVTQDFSPYRINVAVRKGTVVRIMGIG